MSQTISERKVIKIFYFAILREQRGVAAEEMRLGDETPLSIYNMLMKKYNFTLPASAVKAAVNDCFVPMDTVLQNNDQLTFIPPVAGG